MIEVTTFGGIVAVILAALVALWLFSTPTVQGYAGKKGLGL